MRKRRRSGVGWGRSSAPRGKRRRTRMSILGPQRGFLRRAGFYGRFSGARGVRGEHKFLDTQQIIQQISNNGTILAGLNHIAQGNGESERTGRKVTVRSLRIKGEWHMPSTATVADQDQRIRIVVYCDKQTNGTVATIPLIHSLAGTVNINSFRSLANVSRFNILYDKTFNIPINALAASNDANVPLIRGFRFNRTGLNIPLEFDDSAPDGSIATIRTNNIGVYAISNRANEPPEVTFIARIRYSDN